MILIPLLIVLLISSPLPETIPPLPINDLKKIELSYNDTLLKPFPIDTLFLRVYGWNTYGVNIILSHQMGRNTLFNVDAAAGKNQDYTSYLFSKGNVNVGWLTGNFWQELGLSAFWKKRTQEYYRQIGISYKPIWFISSATLTLDNTIRGAQYFTNLRNNFMTATSNLSYNTPSPLGIINTEVNALIQNYYNAGTKTLLSTTAGLSDLITIGDNLYIKPGAKYNIEKKRLSINGNIGFFLKGMATNVDVENNNVNTFYFDTLYSNAFPILVNRYLDYPICNWNIGLSIQKKNLIFSGRYRQFNSYIYWSQTDLLLAPNYLSQKYKDISGTMTANWSPIKNVLTFAYAPDKRNLIPFYAISESINFYINNFDFGVSSVLSGERKWYDQTLPYYITYSISLAYKWRYLKLLANIENILNNKYEIIPERYDLGRKYYIGLEIIPEHKK